jgi:hypothetical protein
MSALPEDDFTQDEWLQIFIERTETAAKNELDALIEFNEFERVRQIIELISEKLPKRIT